MPATAAAYGKDVKSMTPEDNVDLALQILSDNYKRTGSWEDALAMYHSGHDLRTATVRGLSDGHMKTSDYVSSTMAAASSISPENLKKYGYVRY
jgi:soluble lytic murein transglycosylase-like protein